MGHISHRTSEELRHRKIKWLAQSLEGSLWQSRDLNPGFLSILQVLLLPPIISAMQTGCKTDARCHHSGWIVCAPVLLWNKSKSTCYFHRSFYSLPPAPPGTLRIFFCPSREYSGWTLVFTLLNLISGWDSVTSHGGGRRRDKSHYICTYNSSKNVKCNHFGFFPSWILGFNFFASFWVEKGIR